MRWISYFLALCLIGGAFYIGKTQLGLGPELLEELLDSGEFVTMEANYSAEQIMQANRAKLLPTPQHTLLKPKLKYFPFLLLDVKFSQRDKSTEEATVLWSLSDGEMVMDTASWETTHGFEDCLRAGASRTDYRIIDVLAGSGGRLDREELLEKLHVEPETLDQWMDSAKSKHLVVQYSREYRLHFEDPKIQVEPRTRIEQRFVKKPFKHAVRAGKVFSHNQVINNASAAFGSNFAVRTKHEVYLPVFTFEVKNPDGTVATTYWNAISGKQVKDLPLF